MQHRTELREIRLLSLFSGSAQLDIGTRWALKRIGYEARTILYVEQNAHAAEVIKARIRDGLLPDGPIWRDVRTLPASRLRGSIGGITAGFPCQDLSVAGKQSGLGKDTRSGLFYEVVRVASECWSPLIFMENVPGIGSTACATDDGGIWPAAGVVAEALARAGYLHRWLHMAAEDCGAPHGRKRWWCIASMANAEFTGSSSTRPTITQSGPSDYIGG